MQERAIAVHLLRLILEHIGTADNDAVPIGGIYLVDHFKSHGYAALRRRSARGKDETVLHVRPRPRRRSVELLLPVPVEAANRLAKACLGGRVRAVGFRSALDVTRASLLDQLADQIADLITEGS